MNKRLNRKTCRGASMLEFAIVSMLVFTIIFGIIEFGWMFSNHLTLQAASHQGARAAAIGKTAAQVETSIRNAAATLKQDKLTIPALLDQRGADDADWSDWPAGTPTDYGTNSQIRVQLEYDYECLTFVGRGLPGTKDGVRKLKAETVMRYGG